ncbi:MAG: tetratricopeptide repeat protein, partial [Thiotrichales bacterium]|nr:tetratricopeptide repeat protein [Thiotrichales bacterium]
MKNRKGYNQASTGPDGADSFDTVIDDLLCGRLDTAESKCRDLLEANPECSLANYYLAHALERQGRGKESMEYQHQAISLAGDLPVHMNKLGESYYGKGLPAEAAAVFMRLTVLEPGNPEFHTNLANALTALGHHDQALSSIQKAIELTNDKPEVHNTAGLILYNKGDIEKARLAFLDALKCKPDFLPAVNNLIRLLLDTDQAPMARMCLDNLPESARGSSRFKWMDIMVLAAENRPCDLEDALLENTADSKIHEPVVQKLIELYLNQGSSEDAWSYLKTNKNDSHPDDR